MQVGERQTNEPEESRDFFFPFNLWKTLSKNALQLVRDGIEAIKEIGKKKNMAMIRIQNGQELNLVDIRRV